MLHSRVISREVRMKRGRGRRAALISLGMMALREIIELCCVAFNMPKLACRETTLIDMVGASKAPTVFCDIRPEASLGKGDGSPTRRLLAGVVVARSWAGRCADWLRPVWLFDNCIFSRR